MEPSLHHKGLLFHSESTQEPVLANTRKTWERLWEKNATEQTKKVEISQEEVPGSRRSMHGYIYGPTPGLKEDPRALGCQQMGF